MNKKTNAIIAIIIAVYLTVLGAANAVLSIIRYGIDGIADAIGCIIACVIICVILTIAVKNAFKNQPAKKVKKVVSEESDDDGETESTRRSDMKWAFLLLAAGLLGCFGLFGGGIYFLVHMHGDKCVEVLAEVVKADGEVYYGYTAAGRRILSAGSTQWPGVYAVEGRTVKLFYDVAEPEKITAYPTATMFFTGGIFFACIGLLGFCSYAGKARFLPVLGCAGFLDFGIGLTVAVWQAFGFNFAELITSGVSVFLVNILTVFGLYFAIILIISAIKK